MCQHSASTELQMRQYAPDPDKRSEESEFAEKLTFEIYDAAHASSGSVFPQVDRETDLTHSQTWLRVRLSSDSVR